MTKIQIPSTLTHTLSTLCQEMKRKWLKIEHIFRAITEVQKLEKCADNAEIQALQPNQTGFCKLPENIHNWPSKVCGRSLPHSCVGRCHRIYTPLAKRFGSPQAQKSSAPPSLTLLPFMCSAEKGKTPSTVSLSLFHTHTHTGLYLHTHPHDRQHQQQVSTMVVSGGVSHSRYPSCSENQLHVVIFGSPPTEKRTTPNKTLLGYPPFFNFNTHEIITKLFTVIP